MSTKLISSDRLEDKCTDSKLPLPAKLISVYMTHDDNM